MPKAIGYPVSLTTDVSGKDLSLFTERRQTANRPDGQLSVFRAGKPVLFINLQFLAEIQERAGDVNAEKERRQGSRDIRQFYRIVGKVRLPRYYSGQP